MKQFSITQLLLFVTWCGIAFFVLARYLTAPPYQGFFHDLQGKTSYHYGVRGMSGTKIRTPLKTARLGIPRTQIHR